MWSGGKPLIHELSCRAEPLQAQNWRLKMRYRVAIFTVLLLVVSGICSMRADIAAVKLVGPVRVYIAPANPSVILGKTILLHAHKVFFSNLTVVDQGDFVRVQ